MISSPNSMIEQPFATAVMHADPQLTDKHRKPSMFKASNVTRIALAALGLLALCLTPTSVSGSSVSILRRQEQSPLHRKEIEVQRLFGPEALLLDPNDQRPKLLYLMAEADDADNAFRITDPTFEEFINTKPKYDPNGQLSSIMREMVMDTLKGLDPEKNINQVDRERIQNLDKNSFQLLAMKETVKAHQELAALGNQSSIDYVLNFKKNLSQAHMGLGHTIKSLDENFDIRFKIIRQPHNICKEITAASKIGSIKSLIIHAHGDPNIIRLSKNKFIVQDPQQWEVLRGANSEIDNPDILTELFEIDKSCFDGLATDATISLISCNTGKYQTSIASTISKLSKRDVWAPREQAGHVKFSLDIPTIPTIMLVNAHEDVTCKFSPDGSRECRTLESPRREYETATSVTVLQIAHTLLNFSAIIYCGYYSCKWIQRKVHQLQGN